MGQNELKPISKTSNPRSMFSSTPIGATLVDSLDTLYIAGLMEEYSRAKKWVKEEFDISKVVGFVACFFCGSQINFSKFYEFYDL